MDELCLPEKTALLRLAFKDLDEHELQQMAALARLCTYPPGHILCQEGAYEEVFYILGEGNAIISKRISEEEGERILRVAGRGALIGEMALIQNAPRAATVRTSTACTVLEMDKQDFETMLSQSPSMAMDIIRTTLNRMRENDQMAIEDLKKANQVLRQLDRNKLEFIQVAAHELRTPLTVLMGYVNVLRSFPELKENPTLNEVMEGIIKGGDRMREVVNLMLDVTRIDNETVKVASTLVPLKRLVNDLIHDFKQATADRRIELVVTHHPDLPNIYADPTLLQKALYHLVVNAIKYTPDGGHVTVQTCPTSLEGGTPGVEIRVKDSGIGLDAEHHKLVFEKFYQVGDVAIHSSGKTTFKGGGPGVGLAIVRGVARAHGGKVWVESPGHDETRLPGCTFIFQLPVGAAKSS